MAEFDVEDVTRIAHEAAREQTQTVKVAGVVLSAGGSDYIEILVNLEGCHAEPCQFSLGVFRNVSEAAQKTAVAEQLRSHVNQHRDGQDVTD